MTRHDKTEKADKIPDARPDKDDSYPPRKSRPPDSIPNPMPGVDPQQTPGTDHLPAESD